MLTSTKAIVLSKIRYNDHDLIIKCYTQQNGIVSYLLKSILKSKKKNSKIAYFQLLSQLQLETDYKTNRSLQFVKEIKPNYIYTSLHTNIMKSTVAMFIAEVLSYALKEEEKNELLYNYIETSLIWFDTNNEVYSNFHLLFLLNLTKYLGFFPDDTKIDAPYFNILEGEFQYEFKGKYSVFNENLTLLKMLLGTTFDALNTIEINGKQRQAFLSFILAYFELHLGSFKKPKSLKIFNDVFN